MSRNKYYLSVIYMNKIIFGLIFVICFAFSVRNSKVLAAENDYEICFELVGNNDIDGAYQVIETESVYDVPGNGIMLLSNYETIPFNKTVYLNVVKGDGSRETLCSVNLSGTMYYYNDGKVHLYTLGSSIYVYENGAVANAQTSQIENTDGSYSKGSVLFNLDSPEWGFFGCRAWISFTKNSSDATSGLDIMQHILP